MKKAKSGLLLGDQRADALFLLTDLNFDGDAQDAGEAAVWFDAANAEGLPLVTPNGIAEGADGAIYITNAGVRSSPQDVVYRTQDLNGDGDYLDAGETATLISGLDDPAVIRPRALSTYEETLPPTATTVGGGNHFSLFLDKSSNTLFASGENVLGQLGNGVRGYDIKTPLPVTLPEDFDGVIASVSAGLIHGSFLTEDGDVYSWGFGNFGRLGHGDSEDQLIPKKIEALDEVEVVRIENGNGASYAIDAQGKLYAWGQNSNGQLGLGDEAQRSLPTIVSALEDETVVDVSSGTSHTVVLTADGEVYAFGSNTSGQIGSPEGLDENGEPLREVLTPLKVEGLPANVVSITADTRSSFAVTADGRVYGWGENSFGQIGIGTDNGDGTFTPSVDDVLVPTRIEGLPDNVVDVQAGARWVVALTADGDVYAWGPNDEGPTGGLDDDPAAESDGSFFPALLTELDDVTVVEIATGPNSIIAVTDRGEIYTFGSNPDGRLGYRSDGSVYQPTLVDLSSDPEPYLVTTSPADNAREVAPESGLTFTFTEEVFAGAGSLRIVNRDDPDDLREIDVADGRFLSFDGESVTVTPSAFLDPGARYAVELDTGAFVDADGNPVIGFESGDTSSYNFQVADTAIDEDITAVGTRDSDLLRGGLGDDTLFGRQGDDVLFGNGGDDRLTGNRGDDELAGGDGQDLLRGGKGEDTLLGGAGDDRLKGGAGDDLLDGGSGADRLWGGEGEDRFVFRSDSGHDVIEDFETAWFFRPEDRLQIDVDGVDSKLDLLRHAEWEDGDLTFAFDDETSLTLKNTSFLDFIRMDVDFF